MTKKVLLKLHLWLSLPLGVIIILICLSGATLVFKNEIRNALEMPKVIAPHAKSVKVAYSVKAGDEERVGKTIGKFSSKDAPYGTTTKRYFFSYVTKFSHQSHDGTCWQTYNHLYHIALYLHLDKWYICSSAERQKAVVPTL